VDISKANILVVRSEKECGRIDQFVLQYWPADSRPAINRVIKSGELKVNGKKATPFQKLKVGDEVRLPPYRKVKPQSQSAKLQILLENEDLLILNKAAGLPVQDEKEQEAAWIVQYQHERQYGFLKLAHRIDKDTSGILVLAKNTGALRAMEELFKNRTVDKKYLALVYGKWQFPEKYTVNAPLKKLSQGKNQKLTEVNLNGQEAKTILRFHRRYGDINLIQAEPLTGRMHQIRVHLAHLGYPILGDERYGDFQRNKFFAKLGLKRMFLHAWQIEFEFKGNTIQLEAPLPPELQKFLEQYES
jgi:23S rRNA pseudouridine955/2504/2580 synthase